MDVSRGMNDYQQIMFDCTTWQDGTIHWRPIDISDTIGWHREDRDWLRYELEKDHPGSTVVITHHAPCKDFIDPKYAIYGNLNAAYFTSLDDLVQKPISVWVCGHSHARMNFVKNDVLCVMNCAGYPGELGDKTWNSTRRIEIENGVAREL
jgi:hypothetical protein